MKTGNFISLQIQYIKTGLVPRGGLMHLHRPHITKKTPYIIAWQYSPAWMCASAKTSHLTKLLEGIQDCL